MLNIEVLRFETKDIITASNPVPDCICNANCYAQYIDEEHSAVNVYHPDCNCNNNSHWIHGEPRPYQPKP